MAFWGEEKTIYLSIAIKLYSSEIFSSSDIKLNTISSKTNKIRTNSEINNDRLIKYL